MSTSETFTYRADPCPCGDGHILIHVTSPDNSWSRDFSTYGIDCVKCSEVWHATEGVLTHIDDNRAHMAATSAKRNAESVVIDLLRDEIGSYFHQQRFWSMAGQQREMTRLGLSPCDLPNYRKGRNQGKRFDELCSPIRNRGWLEEIAGRAGKLELLHRAFEALDERIDALSQINVRAVSFRA